MKGLNPTWRLAVGHEAIKPEPWAYRLGNIGEYTTISEVPGMPWVLPDWNPTEDLHFIRKVELNPQRILSATGLPAGASINVISRWANEHCRLSGLGKPETCILNMTPDRPLRIEQAIHIPPQAVAEDLTLTSSICLEAASNAADPLAPTRGLYIWSESLDHEYQPLKVILEGSGAQCPMVSCQFVENRNALWQIHWEDTSMDAPLTGAFQVKVNTLHPALSILKDPSRGSSHFALVDGLKMDILRSLFSVGLSHLRELPPRADRSKRYPDDVRAKEGEPATLADTILHNLRSLFDDESLDILARMDDCDSDEFWADVASRAKIYHGISEQPETILSTPKDAPSQSADPGTTNGAQANAKYRSPIQSEMQDPNPKNSPPPCPSDMPEIPRLLFGSILWGKVGILRQSQIMKILSLGGSAMPLSRLLRAQIQEQIYGEFRYRIKSGPPIVLEVSRIRES